MIVCIAEKPSVARDIAHILGANQSHDGYMEGNGYQVTWTFGHLCELKAPEDYTETWKRWALATLPMLPQRFGIRLKNDKGVQKQFNTIKQLMQSADEIINCGDAGQEGELIQRWVMQKAGAKCPVRRLWISSLTEESIREGFANLHAAADYQPLYEAGLCRAIGDWLLGMNATRLYTLKYRAGAYGQPPLSVGRVQTPTLALIVRRQYEIENFKPQPYWVLSTLYRDTTFNAIMGEGKGYATEAEGQEALLKASAKPFEITSVEKKSGTEAPPRLFDLTSLQVECNRKFSYSADQTLNIIQSLYEKKVTTYPRVDTTYLSDDIYPKCKSILNGISGAYGQLLQPLRGAALRKSKKVFDSSKVTDHHAIIPTGQAPNNLSDTEHNVFDLIARRFIAVFYPDCKFDTTTVLGQAGDIKFRTSGKLIQQAGWRQVFVGQDATTDDEQQRDDDEGKILPHFERGESGPHTPSLVQKTTQPPKPYTEATLLRAMETAGKLVESEELRDALKENGIGRPSTRAAIIETLFRRGYIRKQRKALFATPTGVELIGLIKEDLLKSAELTGQWEKKLRQIERREYSSTQFIEELKQMVSQIVVQVMSDNTHRRITDSIPGDTKKSKAEAPKNQQAPSASSATRIRVGSKCPVCGQGKVIKGNTAYGCSRWKEGCTFRKPFKK
ncbi:MAG: DNA topoisomerase 3 [Bacteroidaceae bacterium]|nr:DNA topoisomerase 3 [Bacteroidaceae bacterium]